MSNWRIGAQHSNICNLSLNQFWYNWSICGWNSLPEIRDRCSSIERRHIDKRLFFTKPDLCVRWSTTFYRWFLRWNCLRSCFVLRHTILSSCWTEQSWGLRLTITWRPVPDCYLWVGHYLAKCSDWDRYVSRWLKYVLWNHISRIRHRKPGWRFLSVQQSHNTKWIRHNSRTAWATDSLFSTIPCRQRNFDRYLPNARGF